MEQLQVESYYPVHFMNEWWATVVGKTPRDMHVKASAQLNEKGMSHNPVQYHVEKILRKVFLLESPWLRVKK